MMTKLITAIAIIGISLLTASAQGNSGVSGKPPTDLQPKGAATGNRVRVVGREPADERREQRVEVSSANPQPEIVSKGEMAAFNHRLNNTGNDPRTNPTSTGATPGPRVPSDSSSQEYRVGVGDVLDVQLADIPTRKSTLFTVREGGALEYPLAGDPIVVAGLTADEIAGRLRSRIKVLENPKVVVKVRDYLSHSVIITGLVSDPGAKFLRREAMPLYVILADAQPRPEAINATITRAQQPALTIALADHQAMSALVMPGDLIRVVAAPKEPPVFFYAGGALNQPGQKLFHNGLTLTQAILASGGVTRDAGNKVKIARQGPDGRLSTTEHNWRLIQDGKTPDPILQSGDRITISENR